VELQEKAGFFPKLSRKAAIFTNIFEAFGNNKFLSSSLYLLCKQWENIRKNFAHM